MIFQYTLERVLSGKKTQTRRVCRPAETAIYAPDQKTILAITHNGRQKWCVGRTYGVQPRHGVAQVARIRLRAIRQEIVGDISPADALAEGFTDRQDFFATWHTMPGDASLGWWVWVLVFEVVG